MIRIHKSTVIPTVLQTKGVEETAHVCRLIETDASAYHSAPSKSSKDVTRLPFDNTIYGHDDVKEQLKKDQFEKCCFCEGKPVAFSAGDVEHFRPKAAILKDGERSLTFPAYYWLVYDWSNLLFSCEVCNRRFKRNRFPLENEDDRISSHLEHDHLHREKPLLINPTMEDPEEHITFEAEVPKPKNGSLRGEMSIECYGLGRRELNDARMDYLESVRLISKMMEKLIDEPELIAQARSFLEKVRLPESPFSAMIRANFPALTA